MEQKFATTNLPESEQLGYSNLDHDSGEGSLRLQERTPEESRRFFDEFNQYVQAFLLEELENGTIAKRVLELEENAESKAIRAAEERARKVYGE